MSSAGDLDLFVIGAGSGGVRAARMAARRGARVAIAEVAPLGGTCVNLGCIPKKLYSYASHYLESFEESHGYGWHGGIRPVLDWPMLKKNRAVEIARLNAVYGDLLAGAGVTVLRGRAHVVSENLVQVGSKVYGAKKILIATGGHPVIPKVPGAEFAISSNEIFDLPAFPAHLVVVGAGYIATEFASIFRGLGATVTQLCRGEQLLRGFDEDARHFVAAEMRKKGIDLRTGADVEGVERGADGRLHVALRTGGEIVADTVLCATGRAPNTQGLGLEGVGVRLAPNGAVIVDTHYRSNVESIYAIGDVIDRVHLTPVALAEAMTLVDHLYGEGKRVLDYDLIPTAVFTHPSVGTIGLSEAQARARFGSVRVFRSEFKALKHTLSGSTERTLVKLVVDAATDRVVGLHMVGADAGEAIQGFAVAMTAGATKAQFDATLGVHPTAAEEFVAMREPVARRIVPSTRRHWRLPAEKVQRRARTPLRAARTAPACLAE
ncbi:Glutathione amide reductase [Variovorax sp. PBS-H4]|uniref:glutathione-disulfide reductase n=1 Tax=Variovorax sp. PBS-H4 TaxID=434008 RepID=UPI001318570E|nr:glutathione-disulfide reductase [Variovorax sp. PBS-H4]VTU25878.1 Glutathione amide reductase [Variovorax sp. PBS-H4]